MVSAMPASGWRRTSRSNSRSAVWPPTSGASNRPSLAARTLFAVTMTGRMSASVSMAATTGDPTRRALGPERLDLVGSCLAGHVAGQPLLTGLEEVLRPAIVEVLRDAFLPTELG